MSDALTTAVTTAITAATNPVGGHERAWAGHCGCDGSCASQTFNDDMEVVDARTRQVKRRKQGSGPSTMQVVDGDQGAGSPPLILHLLLLG